MSMGDSVPRGCKVPKGCRIPEEAGHRGVTNHGRVVAYLGADKRYPALQGTKVTGFKR